MFSADTLVKIVRFLGFSLGDKDVIQQALTNIEINAPEFIPAIEFLTSELEQLEATIAEEMSSANSALIRADVLEWEAGARSEGMLNRRSELRHRIYNLLDLNSYGLLLPGSSEVVSGSGTFDFEVNNGW